MLASVLFWCALALLWSHELDAVHKREWRILPLVRELPERLGRQTFIALHVPLFVVTALVIHNGATSVGALFYSAFCVLHLGLHRWFRSHPKYRFNGIGSRLLIVGAGVFGALHIMAVVKG